MSYSDRQAEQGYLRALRFKALTRLYDPVIALTTRERSFRRRLLAQMNLAPGQAILDLGCGTGTLATMIKASEPRAEVFGLDADPEMLRHAQRKATDAGAEITFTVGLADALPYGELRFDTVVSSLFFHHLATEDKGRALNEVRRVLKSRGQLHVADWGRPSDPLMAAASLSVRILDGFALTADNFSGRLPEVIEAEGFEQVQETGKLRTAAGSLSLYSATRV